MDHGYFEILRVSSDVSLSVDLPVVTWFLSPCCDRSTHSHGGRCHLFSGAALSPLWLTPLVQSGTQVDFGGGEEWLQVPGHQPWSGWSPTGETPAWSGFRLQSLRWVLGLCVLFSFWFQWLFPG